MKGLSPEENILDSLKKSYPDAGCELNFSTPYELLIAVVLSAQCTDKRVNQVTETLFKVANTPKDFMAMPLETLEKYIFTCGFYHSKAKSIKSLTADILDKFAGEVPRTLQQLTSLRGVGNKTASVVISVAFGGEALPVDTHVFRVAHRLGLSDGNTADKVMEQLKGKFKPSDWYDVHHTMIFHGRYTCHSQRPDCEGCNLKQFCNYYEEHNV